MATSEYTLAAVGKEGFVLPFRLLGIHADAVADVHEAEKLIMERPLDKTLFILDEDVIDSVSAVERLEEAGANITILKPWGRSEMADRKIRAAAVKAIGTEIS